MDRAGGFYGALTNDLQVRDDVPRSAVLCARILWSYAAAYRRFGDDAFRRMAQRAYDYLAQVFWDREHVPPQAVVGFYNAYQISARPRFAGAALGCWQYIEDKFVDREHGDWFKVLNRAGVPYADHYKVGSWECPYHHSRACFEMLSRLAV